MSGFVRFSSLPKMLAIVSIFPVISLFNWLEHMVKLGKLEPLNCKTKEPELLRLSLLPRCYQQSSALTVLSL